MDNGKNRSIGPMLLALAGALGVVLTLFFPCDVGCEPFVSLRGTLHIFIAVPMGFAIILSILAFSQSFKRDNYWVRYSRYSKVTFIIGVVFAIVTVALAESSMVGLAERVLTISYLQWYVVIGIALMRR